MLTCSIYLLLMVFVNSFQNHRDFNEINFITVFVLCYIGYDSEHLDTCSYL